MWSGSRDWKRLGAWQNLKVTPALSARPHVLLQLPQDSATSWGMCPPWELWGPFISKLSLLLMELGDGLALGHTSPEFELCLQAYSESPICFSSMYQRNFYKSNKVLSDELLCSQNSSNCNLAITQFNAIILHRMTLGPGIGRVTEKIRARTHCARSVRVSNTENRRSKHLVSLMCFWLQRMVS